jgi:predicted deacylase
VVAGFHGDEKLGPWILTYAYPYLILLPSANPSGFVYGTREEQPSRIDPNRDFPFESNEKTCMLGVTSRIIDYIYRRWKIDLTLTIHQGGEEIGWNWGSP